MADWTIFHNPRCSKSRQTLDILRSQEISPQIVEYLKNPPGTEELRSLLQKLGKSPTELLRKKEAILKEMELNLDDEEAVLQAMVKHPVLIERPIVVRGDRAVIGRPPENVKSLIG